MSDNDNSNLNLMPDEEIIYQAKASISIYVLFLFISPTFFFFGYIMYFAFESIIIALSMFTIGLILITSCLLRYESPKIVLTNKRIIISSPYLFFFNNKIRWVELQQVQYIEIRNGGTNKRDLSFTGSIVIHTTDKDSLYIYDVIEALLFQEIALKHIQLPEQLNKQQAATNKARIFDNTDLVQPPEQLNKQQATTNKAKIFNNTDLIQPPEQLNKQQAATNKARIFDNTDLNLMPDEKIIYQAENAVLDEISDTIVWHILLGFACFNLIIEFKTKIIIIVIVALLISAAIILEAIMRFKTACLTLTNKRIINKSPVIFLKNIHYTNLDQIKHIGLDRPLRHKERIRNARIRIYLENERILITRSITDPQTFQEIATDYLNQLKQTNEQTETH